MASILAAASLAGAVCPPAAAALLDRQTAAALLVGAKLLGAGVILATALAHMLVPALLALAACPAASPAPDRCPLSDASARIAASAAVLVGILSSHLVQVIGASLAAAAPAAAASNPARVPRPSPAGSRLDARGQALAHQRRVRADAEGVATPLLTPARRSSITSYGSTAHKVRAGADRGSPSNYRGSMGLDGISSSHDDDDIDIDDDQDDIQVIDRILPVVVEEPGRGAHACSAHAEAVVSAATPASDLMQRLATVMLLAGIVAHSLLVGISLGAADSQLDARVAGMSLHQFLEAAALVAIFHETKFVYPNTAMMLAAICE
ncbi:hypothetical protein HK105_200841 [Polyrhizophydium stewartii]|uniref:Uncharacterized protein n=1 Tax=Polyrhizophydium stewartii TaxID=2732419 RepID=A0ABR4NKG4_9FUNG